MVKLAANRHIVGQVAVIDVVGAGVAFVGRGRCDDAGRQAGDGGDRANEVGGRDELCAADVEEDRRLARVEAGGRGALVLLLAARTRARGRRGLRLGCCPRIVRLVCGRRGLGCLLF